MPFGHMPFGNLLDIPWRACAERDTIIVQRLSVVLFHLGAQSAFVAIDTIAPFTLQVMRIQCALESRSDNAH